MALSEKTKPSILLLAKLVHWGEGFAHVCIIRLL